MYVLWTIEPIECADQLDLACEKKGGSKDNAKDFGMSKQVNAIYSTGKECKWHRFGRGQEFALGMLNWHA